MNPLENQKMTPRMRWCLARQQVPAYFLNGYAGVDNELHEYIATWLRLQSNVPDPLVSRLSSFTPDARRRINVYPLVPALFQDQNL